MKSRTRIIAFLAAAALSYASLFALVGPEKVASWYEQRYHHHGHHHHHYCQPANSSDHLEAEREAEPL